MENLEWKEVRLGELTELITKGTTPSTIGGGFIVEGINFIKSECLNYEGHIEAGKFSFIDEATQLLLKRSILKENDLLFSIAGMYLGKIGVVKKEFLPANTNQAAAIIRVDKSKADFRFIKFFLLEPSYSRFINSLTGQAAQPNMNLADLGNLKIKLPSLPTQQKIAAILTTYDARIENNRRRIAILENMAAGLYREWFVRMRVGGVELEKDRETGLPRGWAVRKLGEVLELKYGRTLLEENRAGGDFPVFGSGGIVGYHNEFYVDANAIIVGRKGSAGTVNWSHLPCYPIDTTFYVQSNLSKYFLYFNLQTQNFINSDAAVPGLNREQAISNLIHVPNDRILVDFDKIVTPIFTQIKTLQQQNTHLRHLRDRLLPRLMSGELQTN